MIGKNFTFIKQRKTSTLFKICKCFNNKPTENNDKVNL